MTGLPPGWISGALSDFIRPNKDKVSPTNFPDLPFVGMDHVEAHTTRIIGSVPAGSMKSNAARFSRNDVLYGRLRPYLNKVAQPRFDGLASAEFIVFRGNEAIDPAFLRHRLNARDFVSFASHLNEGDRPRVSFEQIGNFNVLVPPPDEQRRIACKIEAMFDEIDKGVESLRDAKSTLDLYRKSLLKAAFEGRLTADWRARNPDKLESPDDLLARIRQEREGRYQAVLEDWREAVSHWHASGEKGKKPAKPRKLREIPHVAGEMCILGWATVPLGLVIADPVYGTSKKCDYGAGAKGVIRIPNVGKNYIDQSDLKSADFDELEVSKYSLIEGDILTVRSNGSLSIVGKPAIVRRQDTELLFAGYLIRLRPIAVSLVPTLLLYLMQEPSVRAQIDAKAKSTSGVNNISAKELQELHVSICCPDEQAVILHILDECLATADTLEAEIDAGLALAEALRQSILKKAFAGQLVPQNPHDESAGTLLARIRIERGSESSKRAMRRAKA